MKARIAHSYDDAPLPVQKSLPMAHLSMRRGAPCPKELLQSKVVVIKVATRAAKDVLPCTSMLHRDFNVCVYNAHCLS